MNLFSQSAKKKIEEMVNNVNLRQKGFMACVIPGQKGIPGVLITEEGSLPLVSYSIFYEVEDHAESLYHQILNCKRPSLAE